MVVMEKHRLETPNPEQLGLESVGIANASLTRCPVVGKGRQGFLFFSIISIAEITPASCRQVSLYENRFFGIKSHASTYTYAFCFIVHKVD